MAKDDHFAKFQAFVWSPTHQLRHISTQHFY